MWDKNVSQAFCQKMGARGGGYCKKKDNSSSCVSYFVTWALGIPLRFLSEVLHSTEVRFCVFSSIWEAVI